MSFDKIKEEKQIPYYEDTQKRSFSQKINKIKNTILSIWAYSCPINKLRILFHRWRGVNIGKDVFIGQHCHIDNLYPDYIYIEDNASINSDCMILTHFNPMKRYAPIMPARVAPVLIGEGVILGVRTTILPGVTIGQNSIISAGSVVEKSVPEYTLVRGNPAKTVTDYKYLMTK